MKNVALLVVGGMEAKSKVGALRKKTGQFGGYVMLFGGSEGPPHGQRWWIQML